ncbi:MAG TPA: alkaline phosphatase [Planctomycetaceae bacterium]|nr:alkaline phosphatase [Planctomycetaceae bacterium]
MDTDLLDSFGKPPENVRQFYFETRAVFVGNPEADFTHPAVLSSAAKHSIALLGGPLVGDLHSDGVTVWLRPSSSQRLTLVAGSKSVEIANPEPGKVQRLRLTGLPSDTDHVYSVHVGDKEVAQGTFTTAPARSSRGIFKLGFGSCCHKIGVHNPNLFNVILKRRPHAMMLLGDIAVDDRNNEINMHRADYQLRDVSQPWSKLAANLPLYASWDDHDYFDNDLSGIPKKYNDADREAVREVYQDNWNNPPVSRQQKGIYFSTRVGPIEIIMLDTRSCRDGKRRGKYGSYLGQPQMEWLKRTLKQSTATFKVISSGTMWSDYVSKAKDSWGSWDVEAREELFALIERERIRGVLLVSGDRHGARAFRIPRPSGFTFYEFEPATLGGVSGPAGIVPDCPEQIFGYDGQDAQGNDFIAFGEFTFNTQPPAPTVTFRLVDQSGTVREEHPLTLDQLTPKRS